MNKLLVSTLLAVALASAQQVSNPGNSSSGGGSSGQYSTASAAYTTSAPYYLAPGGGLAANTTEAAVQGVVSSTGSISNFTASVSAAPGANTLTFTWRLGGVSQAVTCAITSTATSCSDTTHSFAIAAGNLIDIQVVATTGTVTAAIVTQWGTGQIGPQGTAGAAGAAGSAGAAATIAIGTTATGAASSSAAVTNSGSSSAAVFNFTVPQGIQGVQGIQGPAGSGGGGGSEAVNPQTGTAYTVLTSDCTKLITFTNASSIAVTLPIGSSLGPTCFIDVVNYGAGTATLTPTTSTIAGGQTSLQLNQGAGTRIAIDASNNYQIEPGLGVQCGTGLTPAYSSGVTTCTVNATVVEYRANLQTGTDLTISETTTSSSTYAFTASPAISVYPSGIGQLPLYVWKVVTSCSGGAITGNIQGLGPESIVNGDGTNPTTAQCASGQKLVLTYDSVAGKFVIVGGEAPGSGGATLGANTFAGTQNVTGAVLATSAYDGQDPVGIITASSCTAGTTSGCTSVAYNHSMLYNQNSTAATAVTVTLPTAAAGKKYCLANSNNGSAADTGTLEILTSASGQYIVFTDGTLSATGGYVVSGGAAADWACVTGIDATHWQMATVSGTWTKH